MLSCRFSYLTAILVTVLLGTQAALQRGFSTQTEMPPVRLAEAAQQGAFNVGTAQAVVTRSADAGTEVLKLDYAAPEGAGAGIWAKAFPQRLNSASIDVVRLGIKASGAAQLDKITVAAEFKGTKGTQRIPLTIGSDWTYVEQSLDWPLIGRLQEAVVLVNRVGNEPVSGTMYLDASFHKLPLLQRLGTLLAPRAGGVLLVSAAGALLVLLVRRSTSCGACTPLGRWLVPTEKTARRSARSSLARWVVGLRRDIVYGAATVFLAGLVIGVYSLGDCSPLAVGWSALGFAVAGAALAEWFKHGLTGKHLTPGEVFQNMLVTGLLAATASSMRLLQAPVSWSEVVMLSSPAAAAAVLVYHLVNAHRLGSSGQHLSPIGAAMIAGTPYVVGSLLLLKSAALLKALGFMLTLGAMANSPVVLEAVGRVAVVFLFNEIVTNGLAWATRRTWLRGLHAHLSLLAIATAVIAAPAIANMGSSAVVASLSPVPRLMATLLATILSQAGLWAEVYLITGLLLDAIRGKSPTQRSALAHPIEGMKKAMIYSGMFMGVLYGISLVWQSPVVRWMAGTYPLVLAVVFGAVAFPLAKTIIESFDGSQAFFARMRKSYRTPTLYARGAVLGVGFWAALGLSLASQEMSVRVWFGAAVGVAAFAGVSLLRDRIAALQHRGQQQPWRVYLVQALFGGFIGAAIGFYLDAAQVSVVVAKYHRYLSAGQTPEAYGVYPLLSKWGFIELGAVTGGVNLLFAEALAGVISWAIPAWLFAINRTVMTACFQKEAAPIRSLLSGPGMAQLTQNMIEVLRWGLWMSPVINSFLRPMGDPTWYNQDGAIRTLFAVFQSATLSPEAFRAWSLQVFIYLLAYDVVRILIWLDHMGLRVATLVNLSFLGMDRLDQRLARLLSPVSTARCIPEGVKRFTTWAPLLVPFYIPRGADWDTAWNQAQSLAAASQGEGLVAGITALPLPALLALLASAILVSTWGSAFVRWLGNRSGATGRKTKAISNAQYEVVASENGKIRSRATQRDYDVTRRSYDLLDPAGRTLFVVDTTEAEGHKPSAWPVVGNYPAEIARPSLVDETDHRLVITNTTGGIRTTIEISLPDPHDPAELWTITVENLTDAERELAIVPYLEWVLNRPDADRGHTQYNRLFAEMEYSNGLHAVLAWDKHSKAQGFLACDALPAGFLTSRIDFIGRARSLWNPRVLETLEFTKAIDTDAHPTFDPIGSLLVGMNVRPGRTAQVRLLIGLTKDKKEAISLIARHLEISGAKAVSKQRRRKMSHSIRHGEIPLGTPQPYCDFSRDGRTLLVHTPFTPRPYDHTLSNRLGHVVSLTNRGLSTTSNGNSQQNRLTPDWPDIVTRELPAEAFYLYDPEHRQWYSPTYHPLNDRRATYETAFSVDGSATYRMSRDTLATELTVFVPPDEPVGVYLLTVKNHGDTMRRIRLAPYFQIVLANQPEHAGPLKIQRDDSQNAVFFENPRNQFRRGPAFVGVSCPAERVETKRGAFFGAGRSVAHPVMVEQRETARTATADDRPVAAFVTTLEIPAHGEHTVAVVLGQADNWQQAAAILRKYRDPAAARAGLHATRQWWTSLMDTVRVKTDNPSFDRYLDWLKYQTLAERIWARRGFYQASGAFGFRDQLQDSVNLIWVDPALARRQIVLHAAQQFLEGDVVHWFHLLQDGRTGFAARTHASDNLLWLAWAAVEYVGATGDESLLDETAAYLEAEQPLKPLPAGKHGMGFDPLRSSRTDTIYQHCLNAIDLVLDKRMGAHGLPLIGTGDWNDGLDEIGSQGRGESVWLGFFLYYILDRMAPIVGRREDDARHAYYLNRLRQLKDALELCWRGDRYLRAIHDDGMEIGVEGTGVWEIDALTAAWAVMSGINPERGRIVFDTALRVLERDTTILLGWPALREDTKPYLGRSSWYPEGVRENGMYSHGVQWLVGAARILAGQCHRQGRPDQSRRYHEAAYRLWRKISAIPHVEPGEIEVYGGQPNKQAADMLTTFDPGRMIWHGYTGAAGWLLRQALEGVLGARLIDDKILPPADLAEPVGQLGLARVYRDVTKSPLRGNATRNLLGGPVESRRECEGRRASAPSGFGFRQ